MAAVTSIEVIADGEAAERLLECLRERAKPYKVGVEVGSTGVLPVEDVSNATDDLRAFLHAQLDECAESQGVDWSAHVRVLGPT